MACKKLVPSISSLHTKLGSFICWNGGRWGSSEAFDAVPLTVTVTANVGPGMVVSVAGVDYRGCRFHGCSIDL